MCAWGGMVGYELRDSWSGRDVRLWGGLAAAAARRVERVAHGRGLRLVPCFPVPVVCPGHLC